VSFILPVAVDFLQHCDYPELTNIISSLALNLIIFTGGFHTRIKCIKPVMVA
jgi:NhaP-type Na+/H+ and K+/H+ antiporter